MFYLSCCGCILKGVHAGSQDFRRIAQFLDGRTTGDCVVYYYRTQKLDEFAAVRRKMQLKKRRMQSENNRAVSYMGIPMAGAAKRSELTTIANPGEDPGFSSSCEPAMWL